MKKESQNIEWKDSWRDEYVKWIAGFANAQGGTLYIGINDKGEVTGLSNAKQLLEEIPNKLRDILGVMAEVNLRKKGKAEYIEIKVDEYPYPVNYKGQYFYRSGSTKQELRNAALDNFLLRKAGRRWDAVPVPNVPIKNLNRKVIATLRNQSPQTNRLPTGIEVESDKLFLQNLRLLEGKYLKRAAVLLFHSEPDKYVSGAFVKIGFFKTDEDLIFQDVVRGSLFEQVTKTMDLLLHKYLKARITYTGVYRNETYPFPPEAIREALLNALAHKDYASGIPIQISVYSNRIIFWNGGHLPDRWTTERLKKKHPSIPYNPDIANTFFAAGLIEMWGRGTLKILSECKNASLREPLFTSDNNEFSVTFFGKTALESPLEEPLSSGGQNPTLMDEKMPEQILSIIQNNSSITIKELSEMLGKTNRTIERHLKKLQDAQLLTRIGSKKTGHWEIAQPKERKK